MSEKEKKPVFKKVWFWVIVVIVLIAIGASGANKDKATVVDTTDSTSSDSSSSTEEKTTFNVGEVIAFDGKEVTVKSVERNWNSGNQFITPSDGKEFVKVNVAIENKSDSEASFNTFDWKIEDSNGAIESSAITASADDSLGSGDLAAGGKKEGSVIFEVPQDSSLKIHYQPSFWSSRKIVINV